MELKLNTDIFHFNWYIQQMRGWSLKTHMLLMLGLGIIIGTTISSPINWVSLTTMVAAILGFTCTLAITNAKPLNGILGLLSAIMYIIVAIHAKNYADVVLQLSYMLLLDLPVLMIPAWNKDVEKHIKGLNALHWLYTVIFFIVITGLLYYMDTKIFISPRPWIDAIAGSIGVTGSLLCTLRFREQYYFWTFQGIMSVVLWGVTAVQGDANVTLFFTYILYLSNDFLAFTDKHTHWFH